MEVKNGPRTDRHVVKEANVDSVTLLPKLDNRSIFNLQLVKGETVVLTLDKQVGLASYDQEFGHLRHILLRVVLA